MIENVRMHISMWFAYQIPAAMVRRGYSAETRELIRIDTGNWAQGHNWLVVYWYCLRLLVTLRGPVHSL